MDTGKATYLLVNTLQEEDNSRSYLKGIYSFWTKEKAKEQMFQKLIESALFWNIKLAQDFPTNYEDALKIAEENEANNLPFDGNSEMKAISLYDDYAQIQYTSPVTGLLETESFELSEIFPE